MPKVSVILPVYNGEKFLREAIDSILAQTFTDFELLLMNDGSTDGSEAIIQSYTDPRIVYVKNEKNSGLIYTLNRGIDLAQGEYIARMDADDVALPERLEKQLLFFSINPEVGVVATTITFVNERNEVTGSWPLDQKTITPASIRKAMAVECCIAHPTVLVKRELFAAYKFDARQKHIEDYDLWLRMMTDGVVFGKVSTSCLRYRLHPSSVTQTSNQTVLSRKRILFCKIRFIKTMFREHKFRGFCFAVIASLPLDLTIVLKKYIFDKNFSNEI